MKKIKYIFTLVFLLAYSYPTTTFSQTSGGGDDDEDPIVIGADEEPVCTTSFEWVWVPSPVSPWIRFPFLVSVTTCE